MANYNTYRPEISDPEENVEEVGVLDNPEAPKTPSEPAKRSQKVKRKPVAKKPAPRKPVQTKRVEEQGEPVMQKIVAALTGTTARVLVGIFLIILAAYLSVSFVSYLTTCIADQSEIANTAVGTSGTIHNAGGEGGARLAQILINDSFGLGSIAIIVWLVALSLKSFGAGIKFKTLNFTIKCIIALIAVSLIIGLLTIGLDTPVNWGGVHGRYVNEFVVQFLGWIGAVLLCIFVIAVFVSICMRDVVKWIIKMKRKNDARRAAIKAEKEAEENRRREIERLEEQEIAEERMGQGIFEEEQKRTPEGFTVEFNGDEHGHESAPMEYDIDDVDEIPESGLCLKTDDGASAAYVLPEEDEPADAGGLETEPAATAAEEPGIPGRPMLVNVNEISQVDEKRPEAAKSPGVLNYKFPPFELLREGSSRVCLDQAEQLENEQRIRNTLADFGINITSIEATIGPTVTLYEIVPDIGVKISKISSLADDIALRLAAKGVRIIPQVPGKGTVGIEVPNKDPQTVSMRTVLKSRAFLENKFKLPVALGSTISNEVFITDLTKMPHLLVAGATGQGKSVGLNALITSLLYSKRPDELKFVMIDPKMVEFSLYSKIEKHYLAKLPDEDEPIVTDMQKVVPTLSSLCVEMDDRYVLLKKAGSRNIEEYNTKIKEGRLNPEEGHRFLPYIVIVVDEFADLIMVSGKEVEMPIARLAQKARAIGMHVIIATQRPSTNVITGVIKGNFTARIAFRVGSGVDSKTILDVTGAQSLIGRGDMLISLNSEVVRVQCAFIDTPEVEAVCDYIERQPYGSGAYILPEPIVSGSDDTDGRAGANTGDRDPLFDEIARRVVTASTASTSSLQRSYGIGYNRAGRIMDQLEAAGIVGPSHDGKPRNVLVDATTLEAILNN